MATALAGEASNSATGTSLTVTRTTASASFLVLAVQHLSSVTGVTDSAGNTWVALTDSVASSAAVIGTAADVQVWICPNASAITQVTVTVASSGTVCAILAEFTGCDRVTYGYNFSYAASVSSASAAVTTFNGSVSCLFVGYTEVTSGTRLDSATKGTLFTSIPTVGTQVLTGAYKLNTTTADYPTIALSTARAAGVVELSIGPALTSASFADPVISADVSTGAGSTSWSPTAETLVAWTATSAGASAYEPAKPTVGQLWPRGTKGDGSYS